MKKLKKMYSYLIVLLAVTSCAPRLTVSIDYDKNTDFTKFKTFSLYRFTDKSPAIGVSELNRNRIINAVKNELIKKGYVETGDSPDFMVNVTAILKERKEVVANTSTYGTGGYYRPYGWGPSYGGTTTYSEYSYIDGSLIIDAIDNKSQQLIWQGIGNKEIDTDSKNPDTNIPIAVAEILKDFFIVKKGK